MEKIYYTDPYISAFSAEVMSCEKTDKGFAVILDRTAFFPEQGGQYSDEGTLDGIKVTDVQEKAGEIIHFTEREITPGKKITGEIDFRKRFDRMQNHTGEHIMSGVIHNRFGYDNVGFHLSDEEMTMDTSGPLSSEELKAAEEEANRVVFGNLPVDILYPTPEELGNISYRSKLDITENVRLVKIGDVDICACCAPHVKNTGEIGMIKILKAIRYKGGMRLTLCCGSRAYADYSLRYEETEKITSLMKAKTAELSAAVESLQAKHSEEQYRLKCAQKELLRLKISQASLSGGSVCLKSEIKDTEVLRDAVNFCMERTSDFCLAYCGNDEDGYSFVLGKINSDAAKESSVLLTELKGKGGGRGNMISGTLRCGEKDIREHFNLKI